MKPRLRLAFSDFKAAMNPANHYFTRLLREKYDVELSDQPEIVIYSCYGSRENFRRYPCTRVYYTSENLRPNFADCDYAFTFDYCDHPNHYRLPQYALHCDVGRLVKTTVDPQKVLAEKIQFCNFVYSNRYCRFRNAFFRELSKYKHVDAGGRLFNNVGGRVKDKLEFIRQYKFTLAFENSSYPGYTTEKIGQPMLMNSLPIYWGNPLVHRDFNPASFLNYFDYGSPRALIERIIEVDRNDELYCQYVSQPWFHGNRPNAFVDKQNVLAQFEKILSSPQTPIALKKPEPRLFLIRQTRNTKLRLKKNWGRLNRWAKYHWDEMREAS
ncbi:MAG TPA: glycosyltransferase family 10 [Pirellulales bacterium]|nr:glycosyltransferase family 10 [Pirellulales bacterium]